MLGWLVCWKLPRSAQLEVTTICNLSCPLCTTHVAPRDVRQLSQAHIENVTAGCGHRLKVVNFHLLGEPLMHRDLFRFVRHCEAAGVRTTFSTNGMLIDRHVDELIDSGLSFLSIAIDGANAADYGRYRIGGDWEKVVRNTRALLAARRARGVSHPVIQVQMVMFSYNEDNERACRAFLADLGADIVSFKRPSYIAESTQASERFLAQVDHHGAAERRFARPIGDPAKLYRNLRMCPQLERATVLSDGKVVACCMDANGETAFGNVNETPFRSLWRGPAHRDLVARFMRRDLSTCEHCTLGYRDLDAEPAPLADDAPAG